MSPRNSDGVRSPVAEAGPPRRRPPRDFNNERSRGVVRRAKSIFFDAKAPLCPEEFAEKMRLSVRQARDYLNHLHDGRYIYIVGYRDNLKGRKTPCYKRRRTGKELDAPKSWLDPSCVDSNGGLID